MYRLDKLLEDSNASRVKVLNNQLLEAIEVAQNSLQNKKTTFEKIL